MKKRIIGFLRKVALFPLNILMGTTTNLSGTDISGATNAGFNRPAHTENKKFVMKSNLITIPAGGLTNDILNCLPIKAGWLVKAVNLKVVTAGAGTAISLDAGITGGVAAGFLSAVDGTQAAGTVALGTGYNSTAGYLAAANTTIDVKLHTITAMTTPTVFQLFAEVTDLN